MISALRSPKDLVKLLAAESRVEWWRRSVWQNSNSNSWTGPVQPWANFLTSQLASSVKRLTSWSCAED